jgi:hypothetical protein
MELPAPLLSWREWLAWFSPDLAAEVGELVRRLHPLIGQFRSNRVDGEPQPDGLGNLHRRGPYQRLLASEWLIAEEIPDEFLRRAVAGEHLFLAPQPRAQQAEKLIIALFDTGPLQLGSPRLAQLALWILLARRAREAGGELRWGSLQATPVLHEADNATHLHEFLKARTYTPATLDHLTAWREWLDESGLAAREIWLVGADLPTSALEKWGCTHQVITKPSLEGNTLDVVITQGGSVRQINLPLPEAKPATRLLKGQFQSDILYQAPQHHPTPYNLAIVRPPLISWQGKRVAVTMLKEQGAMVFPVPRQGSGQTGKPRRQQWSARARPLSMMFSGKKLGALLDVDNQLSFWQLPKLSPCPRPSHEVFEAPPGLANFLPTVWLRSHAIERLYVLDKAGRLAYWQNSFTETSEIIHNLDSDVLNLAQVADNCFIYVRRDQEQLCVYRVNQNSKEEWRCPLGTAPSDTKIVFGGGSLWHRGIGGCAVRMQAKPAEIWRLYTPGQGPGLAFNIADVTLQSGCQGIGFVQKTEDGSFGLLAIGQQRKTLSLYSGRREQLYTTSSAISKITVCSVSGLVAMLTHDRDLIVYSVPDRHVRLIVNGSGIEYASD